MVGRPARSFMDGLAWFTREKMSTTKTRKLTPVQIIAGIERLSEADKETLAILADKKLSQEILKRRRMALDELEGGKLLTERQLADFVSSR